MNVLSALVTDFEPAETIEPSKRAFNYPPIFAQLLAALDTTTRDARENARFLVSARRETFGEDVSGCIINVDPYITSFPISIREYSPVDRYFLAFFNLYLLFLVNLTPK